MITITKNKITDVLEKKKEYRKTVSRKENEKNI